MKHNNQYQKMMEERLKKVEAQILNDSLTNSLLDNAKLLPDYFKYWIDGSKLVAVLPALDSDNPKAQSYYSIDAIEKEEKSKQKRLSPVFMYINDEKNFKDLSQKSTVSPAIRFFTFDSEDSKLYSYEKEKYSPNYHNYHFVKKDGFDKVKNHIINHPVVLFFQGCDDGHVGKRFKTELEAMEYLQLLDTFEDIFEEDLEYHN